MPNVKFLLKEPKSTEVTLILMYFRFEGERLRYSTQEKVHPEDWNSSEQRVRKNKDIPYDEINTWLDKLETNIKSIYRELKNNDEIITKSILKNQLNIKIKGKKIEIEDFFSFADKYIESLKSLKKSYKSVRSTLNLLKGFEAEYGKVDFNDIDVNFYRKFYMTERKTHSSLQRGWDVSDI